MGIADEPRRVLSCQRRCSYIGNNLAITLFLFWKLLFRVTRLAVRFVGSCIVSATRGGVNRAGP
jgi:hypothetical protein